MTELRMPLTVGQTVGIGWCVRICRHLMIKCRVAWRYLRNHLVPLAIELCIITFYEFIYLATGILRLLGKQDIARLMVSLCIEELTVHLVGRMHRIAQHLEKSGSQFG